MLMLVRRGEGAELEVVWKGHFIFVYIILYSPFTDRLGTVLQYLSHLRPQRSPSHPLLL